MIAHKGQIVDATFIEAPKQRNPKDENELIKANRVPVNWTKNKRAQKDTAARWTIKGNERHYGYKENFNSPKVVSLSNTMPLANLILLPLFPYSFTMSSACKR